MNVSNASKNMPKPSMFLKSKCLLFRSIGITSILKESEVKPTLQHGYSFYGIKYNRFQSINQSKVGLFISSETDEKPNRKKVIKLQFIDT